MAGINLKGFKLDNSILWIIGAVVTAFLGYAFVTGKTAGGNGTGGVTIGDSTNTAGASDMGCGCSG